MADLCEAEIVTKFLIKTSRVDQTSNADVLQAASHCAHLAAPRVPADNDEVELIPLITGSVAEFYIQPMPSCVGDIDIMFHRSDQLAIPAETAPPTQLPDEFHSRVKVYEIIDSEFPGYVYLVSSYLLTECIDDDKYNAVLCPRRYWTYKVDHDMHGPAFATDFMSDVLRRHEVRLAGSHYSNDTVPCIRCLSWPSQAADWPTRRKNYGWPDSATVDHVVGNGCDVVQVAHRQCRQHEWMSTHQWRLSFSRTEIVLLNSWIPVQQIVYHMLRVFVKLVRLTDSANNSDVATLSNYHIKTLMLWACELKPRSWLIDDLNVVRLSVELLHTLAVWLTDARCPHYFIHNCNLFDHHDNCYCEIASRLMPETETSLAKWFTRNYIVKCARVPLFPGYVSQLFDNVTSSRQLQQAVSAVVDCRLTYSTLMAGGVFTGAQGIITYDVSRHSLTVLSCLYWMRNLVKIDQSLGVYFTAVTFLHIAHQTTTHSLTDEPLDVLATTCLQSNDVRRCHNARHSSVLSLSQAAKLMKVVANTSRSTVQLIEIELSKGYLYTALRCKDSDSDSIYCLANIYLVVLYYTTGHYQTAIDHCTLMTRSQDHSQCSSHVVQGELLPKIDDDIDSVLGLAVLYQYVRTAALNQQQQTQHVNVFTTELFAHYLHIRCLSVMKCRQLTQTSSADEAQRWQKCFHELHEIFITDVLFVKFMNRTKYLANDQIQTVVGGQTMPEISRQLDTSELVELLQQSAVEHLTTFRQREAHEFSSLQHPIVTTDFEALYAYKRGEYRRCLQLSTHNVRTLIGVGGFSLVFAHPEFIQLMDDDIVPLTALTLIVNPSCRDNPANVSVRQLYLSLYLMTQCQMKLHHPVTSLAQTLHYVKVARRHLMDDETLAQLLLNLTERKLLLYLRRALVQR